MSTDRATRFLLDRINYERTSDIPYGKREFKLNRMRHLLRRLGDPQERLRAIHVAGSKGKGSTATMIAEILTAAGLRTGLFTSPHLLGLEERFKIQGANIATRELNEIIQSQIEPVVTAMDEQAASDGKPWDTPTFFEVVTAIAMLHFARQSVDVAVLEVGLGGRLDSTNTCQPECCVITSISLDHTRQLGTTHREIAREKAGILKPGVPLVTGVTHPEALQAVSSVAQAMGIPQWTLHEDFDFQIQSMPPARPAIPTDPPRVDLTIGSRQSGDKSQTLPSVQLGMWGKHQAANAAVAAMTVSVLMTREKLIARGWKINERAIRQGLRRACCPARIELVSEAPYVVIDTAHNTASIWALTATLNERFPIPREKRIVIFSASQCKDCKDMLDLLVPWAKHVILTKYQNNPRAAPIKFLKQLVRPEDNTLSAETPETAMQLAYELSEEDSLICVTGSFFLASEMLQVADPARLQ